MTNITGIIFYMIMVFLIFMILLLNALKRSRSKLDGHFIFVGIMLTLWASTRVLFFVSIDFGVSKFLYDLDLPFVALTALGWFSYIMRFYGLDSYLSKTMIAALAIIPVFTFVLVLTTSDHTLIRSSFELLETYPRHLVVANRGLWFWFHSVYCYLLMLAGLIVTIVQHRKVKKEYKQPSFVLLWSVIIVMSVNVVVLRFSMPVDITLVSCYISLLAMYFSMKNYEELSFFIESRKEAFQYIDNAVLIVDDENNVITSNRMLREWMEERKIDYMGKKLSDILQQLQGKYQYMEKLQDEESGVDYYDQNHGVMNIRRREIFDSSGKEIASFIIVTDETENRKLIEELDKFSGMDALTGLLNRRQLTMECNLLREKTCYPVCILVGDVNGLKKTNDTYGHEQGDVLLRLMAEVLKRNCPPNALVSRTGGDEFVIVLQNAGRKEGKEVIKEIAKNLKHLENKYPYNLSIAMGISVIENEEEDWENHFQQADKEMYKNKKRSRA
ncbi:diguanylate cyclase (GGDEF)-like protein [Aequitasia blattaphilus]|uniref:Diguanylate cyclase n=1 Tax=Aequitasia blattaphilus TaxID=2949332 RepID=A0ABT1EAC5_9FIRM|nr:diguanylate cyclase [Aequitasia blattaphilus]MCP1102796.1 diguanylate cyclase [Aequitasia blattaphilus]MCR8615436.1 diguanylate cyclase [Aequitasia blattaphilus]